jgi:hypothetical protein
VIIILQLEFAITASCCLGFVLLFGDPRWHQDRLMAWHLTVFTAATGLEALALYAASRGVVLPTWVYPPISGLVSFAAAWRLSLYLRGAMKQLSLTRKVAAALAGLQIIVAGSALTDVLGAKWAAFASLLVAGAQAALATYQRPAAEQVPVQPKE